MNKGRIIWFVSFYLDHLPDISEVPEITDTNLRLWMRKQGKVKKKDRKKPHNVLGGLCGKWVNMAIDFAIEMNEWAVKYVDKAQIHLYTIIFRCLQIWLPYMSVYFVLYVCLTCMSTYLGSWTQKECLFP